ncbi:Hypothetical protein POVN_LOCUS402 [uncultured virus]|nr:Hypothetical protein POVN_LOCUS402 [uncultured virus]
MATSGVYEVVSYVKLKYIPFPSLVRVSVLADGNCFFHAILRAFNRTYITATNNHIRQTIASILRHELAAALEEKDATGKLVYDTLAKGTLREFSKGYPAASLSAMQSELKGGQAVDNLYHELISNQLDKDIYFIDLQTEDVYVTSSDLSLLYKARDSIFIVYTGGHYDLLGVWDGQVVQALFSSNHPLTQLIQQRLQGKVIAK